MLWSLLLLRSTGQRKVTPYKRTHVESVLEVGGGEGSEAAPWPARSPRAGQRKCLHTNKHMYIGSVLSGSS